MSDQEKPAFGPDADLYAKMSEPYETQELANAALMRFMLGVKKLREECRVSEVMLIVATNVAGVDDKGPTMVCQALTLGSAEFRPELAARAFQMYTAPVLERAERLRAMSFSAQPTGEEEDAT